MPIESILSSANDVSAPLAEYSVHQNELSLVKAIHGGTKTMRLAAKKYLPQEDGESENAYNSRLNRSVMANFYKKTITKLTGQAFKEDIAVSEEVEEGISKLFDDIDLEGNSLSLFMSGVFSKAIHKGVNHVMVEYPKVEGATTVADHKKAGARPYWVEIDPDNIIGWRFKTEGGAKMLTQLRVKETVTVDDGLYGNKQEDRIRLYEPGSWKVLTKGKDGWATATDKDGGPMEGTTSIKYIPLVTLMLGEKLSDMTALPCLGDLAELNCTHWQSSSDQRNILHYARLITYFGKMLTVGEDGKIIFGANKLIHSTHPESDLKIVEHSGAGIEAGRNDLKDLELVMALFGLTMMLPKVSGVTATENTIDKGESDSELATWVKAMGSMLETLYRYTCEWIKVEPKGELTPFSAWTSPFGSTDGALIVEAYKAGLMPQEMALTELHERGIITSDIDMIEIAGMVEKDNQATTMMAKNLAKATAPPVPAVPPVGTKKETAPAPGGKPPKSDTGK